MTTRRIALIVSSCEFPQHMSPRPDLGPKPHLGYVQSRLERAAELRTDNAAITRLAAEPRAGAYVIGGDHIVMTKGGTLNDPLFTMDDSACAWRCERDGFPRVVGRRRPLRLRHPAGGGGRPEDPGRLPCHRSALNRGAGAGRARAPAADRRGQGSAALARPPPLLPELRREPRRPCLPAGDAIARTAKRCISRAPIRW